MWEDGERGILWGLGFLIETVLPSACYFAKGMKVVHLLRKGERCNNY